MPPELKRRDTPAEGMPAVQHISEADDHFVVTYADGLSTVIPKEGLKADTLAHFQGMAHGGEVRGISGGRIDPGGANDDNMGADRPDGRLTEEKLPPDGPQPHVFIPRGGVATVPAEDDLPPAREAERPIHMAEGGGVPDAGFAQTSFAPLAPFGAMDAGTPVVGGLPFQFTPGGAIPAVADPLLPNVTPEAAAATRAVDVGAPYGMPSSAAVGPAPQRGMVDLRAAPTPTAPTPQPTGAPTGTPMPGHGGSGALTELNKGLAEQRAGLQAQVDVETQRDAALMQLQDAHIAKMQALEAQSAEQLAAHQRRADDLFQATLNAKIDPNRVWSNADLGQRVAAGIGILLSGIGQGLAGGPNMALQQVNRIIDLDVDAQKTNLENQRSLLAHYLQQGRDMLSATQLAKADLKDMFAAQLTRVSAQFGGQEAAARAQMAGGQLRTEAAGKRQEIMARDFQMASQRAAMGLEMERNRLIGAFTAQMGKPGGVGAGAEQLWELMPKDVRERRVRLPNGGWGLAKDAPQATDLAKGFEKIDEFKRLLQNYQGVLQNGSPKLWTGFGGNETAAQSFRAQLQAAIKDAEALGALSKGDYEFIDRQIPDISAIFTGKASKKQGLEVLGSVIDGKVTARLKTLGML